MNTQRNELYIGAMVIAAIAVLILLTIQFSKRSFFDFSGTYKVAVRFEAAPGVALSAPVYKNGVKIGSVASVQLVDDDRAVEVVLLIQSNRRIYTNEECRLTQSMIMNDTKIEFVRVHRPLKSGELPQPEETLRTDGLATINGVVPNDLFSSFSNIEGDLQGAIQNVSGAAEGLAGFMKQLSTFVGTDEEIAEKQQRITNVIVKAEETMDTVNRSAKYVNDIIADPTVKNGICDGIKEFPDAMKKARDILDKGNTLLDKTHLFVDDVRTTAGHVDGLMAKVNPLVDTLSTDIPKISGSLQRGAGKFESITSDIAAITGAIAAGDGPVQQLLSDPSLYTSVRQVVNNVEEITGEVKPVLRNAKPIMDNVQVLTDKMARDPSVIVRGVLRKQTPIKGGLPQWGDGLGSDGLCTSDLAMIRAAAPGDRTASMLLGRNTREYPAPRSLFSFCLWPFCKKEPVVAEYSLADQVLQEYPATFDGMPMNEPAEYRNGDNLPESYQEEPPIPQRIVPPRHTPEPRLAPVPDVSAQERSRIIAGASQPVLTYVPAVETTSVSDEPQLVFTPERSTRR